MLQFKEIKLEDKGWMDEKFKESDLRGCEYSFCNNFIWRNIYKTNVTLVNHCLVIKTGQPGKEFYSFPIGNGDKIGALEEIRKELKEKGEVLRFRGVLEEQKKEMEQWFPEIFSFESSRDDSDYIYTVEKLTKLSGKKLHGKRNHIARFMDNPNWQYEPIKKDNIEGCYEMNQRWCKLHDCATDKSLRDEMCAVKEAFHSFFELGLQGGLVRMDGDIISYSIGEPLSSDTYVVHIEKAFPQIQGAYPMMNQQFVLHHCQEYTYVNREEDTGEEGLRKAKLSYYPDILLEKYVVTERKNS